MDLEIIRDYCLSKTNVTESLPFDDRTLVFKVENKMFALCDIVDFKSINLKCNPEKAIELREMYEGVLPGYHMNKVHWNTVLVHSDVKLSQILEMIDDSYWLIVNSLSKKLREKYL